MTVVYKSAARLDITRQFRYYLLIDLPAVAVRFKEAVRETARRLRRHPENAPPYFPENPRLPDLRSWPIEDFEVFRMYFLIDNDTLRVIRILHSKRNVRRIIAAEPYSADQ